jgi:superfamily II DNA or RNA helicase
MTEAIEEKTYKSVLVSKEKQSLQDFFISYSDTNPKKLNLVQPVDKEPRYYQVNAIRAACGYLENNFRRLLYIQPTGTGKTLLSKLTALDMDIRKVLGIDKKPRIRVVFIANSNRLLRQARREFSECHDVDLYTHSAYKDIPADVIEAGFDMVFIDEAHHEAMFSIQQLLDHVKDCPVFGFTATPDRGDGLLLKFERYIFPITKEEAIRRKFIATPKINSIIDTSGTNKLEVCIQLVNLYHKQMNNTIVYFKTNKECEGFYEYCMEAGHTAHLLRDDKEMDEVLERFSNGEIKFLINCKKLGEGTDIKNCTDVLLARQFNSKGEKEQYIGRSIRPDSPCCVWEFVNPIHNNILAKDIFPVVSIHRLIFKQAGEWHERILEENKDEDIYDYEYLDHCANNNFEIDEDDETVEIEVE